MTDKLKELVASAASAQMSAQEREAQRLSFAYGNTHFENGQITRSTVQRAADRLLRMQAARNA